MIIAKRKASRSTRGAGGGDASARSIHVLYDRLLIDGPFNVFTRTDFLPSRRYCCAVAPLSTLCPCLGQNKSVFHRSG